jgi:hypothetical protein
MDLHQVCCVVSLVGIVVYEYEKQEIFQPNDAPPLFKRKPNQETILLGGTTFGWLNFKLQTRSRLRLQVGDER